MALTFFKTQKNKQFSYRPLYYDPKKEEREKRLKTAIEENPNNVEAGLRERMDMRWRRMSRSHERKASNQKLIIIIIVVVFLLIAYLIFF